jgi:TolB protein
VAQKHRRLAGGGQRHALADGRFDVRFRLWDVVRGRPRPPGLRGAAADLRLAAHRIADMIYEKLTGEKGVFSTRIAYVTKAGNRYNLWVADADGENAQVGAGQPRADHLAGLVRQRPAAGLRVLRIAQAGGLRARRGHRQRRLIANFRGSNSAPAWSPDGRTLAVTLTRDGGSQLYTIPASGGEPRA